MRVVDAVSMILSWEGVEFLSCYPTSPLIEAAAQAGIRPIVCRQERVGADIADGFTRVSRGHPNGVFSMQYGPGAENAFPGVATAFSDSVPMLFLPMGHRTDRAQVFPNFSSYRVFGPVTKSVETLSAPGQVGEVMRRAFSLLRMGRPGPVMVEIPWDLAEQNVDESVLASYNTVKRARSAADPQDVARAAEALLQAKRPLIYAGQGVLYADASDELVELAELVQAPVITSLEGKSAFPEDHPLSIGTSSGLVPTPIYHFVRKSDLVFGVGCSMTSHNMAMSLPTGKAFIHATGDERDINKNYPADYPVIGDAKLVLRQFIDAVQDLLGRKAVDKDGAVAEEIKQIRDGWLKEWMPKLTSGEVPLNPYRIIREFMRAVDPAEAIVTHDAGGPRNQLVPFYKAGPPWSYIGWGKSHALGTGLGLTMGAKLAAPDKFCVNFMGDAAFGMTGLDFETAVRCKIPILTIVLNNSIMAIEERALPISHERYGVRDIGGNYADMARDMGGYSERIEGQSDIAPAIKRARAVTENGQPVLLEFITCAETAVADSPSV